MTPDGDRFLVTTKFTNDTKFFLMPIGIGGCFSTLLLLSRWV